MSASGSLILRHRKLAAGAADEWAFFDRSVTFIAGETGLKYC
jgi:hypothetical protein